ncbi:hypothetical protein GGTG_08797 [Gaeumannomyces tritici R3-111a-1]|uniref:Uncharacterized protein n=1 Tax=Gaeumannomyces tritici (strain R3-111a-1) TaxID=644352 RepID=J3P5K7_GAET3|nr:hypothetical protein GGTG_08797 [Gaeumannomyces tritici R3-111a-1]EJT74959.1 hypothetical protein GGTG_08797 [Gaeumannomyces tritici R3-111a-1]
MAAMIETPAQFERDLRSAHKGWKRGKDSRAKWAHGHRPAAGVKWNHFTGGAADETPEVLLSKSRPDKKYSDYCHDSHHKKHPNYVKVTRPLPYMLGPSNGRPSGRMGARGEIEDPEASRSIIDLLVPAARKESWGFHSMDGVLYSFDAVDTPSRPVTLETFVKANNRTTEKMVEKEYEILDANGELLKGRKARSDLRKSANGAGGSGGGIDDDDFELV